MTRNSKFAESIVKVIFVFALLLVLYACQHEDEDLPQKHEIYSRNYSITSHKPGENCNSCHSVEGTNNYVFRISGTVYDSTKNSTYPNTFIKLYSAPNGVGNILDTIEVDAIGNFYSSSSIDYSKPVYPVVVDKNGIEYRMSSKISHGACNACHGVLTNRIFVLD